MWLLILLFTASHICNAVYLNSNYFKSDFIVPSDCTIQPTQQECIKYAQLTMTPEVVHLEVVPIIISSVYVEVTSGVNDGSVNLTECQTYWTAQGKTVTVRSAASFANWPHGCVKRMAEKGSSWCDTNGCEPFQDGNGMTVYGEAQPQYVSSGEGGCETSQSRNWFGSCIQQNIQYGPSTQNYSYYNFGHVEVTAGAAALESDIRHVSEKECEAYAGTIGATWKGNTNNAAYPKGCVRLSGDRIYWVTNTGTSHCGDYLIKCIQRDVITHHVAAEGCLSDGKVRWNIPFLEVSSGSPASLGVEVTEGTPNLLGMLTQSECQAYGGSNWGGNGYTYISDQDSLSHSAGCTGWAGGNECDTNPSYMWGDCKKECSKRGSPTGCVQRGSEVWYNEYDSSRNCGYAEIASKLPGLAHFNTTPKKSAPTSAAASTAPSIVIFNGIMMR